MHSAIQILKKTDTELLLKYKPLCQFAGVVSVVGGVLGLLLFEWIMFSSATLTCQRGSQNQTVCELTRSTFLGRTSTTQILNPVWADIHESRPQGRLLYEIIISTATKQVSLLAHPGGSKQDNQTTAFHINKFIQDPNQSSFKVNYDGQDFLAIERFLLTGIAVIGAVLMTSATVTWTFDKNRNQVIRERRRLSFNQVRRYPLSNVTSIQVEQNPSVNLKTNERHHAYRIILILAHTEHIPLTSDYPFFYKREVEVLAQNIQQFLSDNSSL
jgi:hypothetical protein